MDIKRQLGIGQGTLADKERDYQSRPAFKPVEPPKPKVDMHKFAGVWWIDDGSGWRQATTGEIKQHAPITILDNDDD